MPLIRLLAIDVDGTLLDSRGQVPEANLDAIAEAASSGARIAIVTGRSFSFALPAVERLADPLTLVVYNGAIARMRSGETLLRRLLPREAARDVLAATEAWRDSALLQFDRPSRGQLVYDRLDWTHPNRVKFREKNLALIEEVPALEDALVEDPIQIAFNGSVATMRALVDTLRSTPALADLSISLTEYLHRDFSLVDVAASQHDQGHSACGARRTFAHRPQRRDGRRRQFQRSRDARMGRNWRRHGKRQRRDESRLYHHRDQRRGGTGTGDSKVREEGLMVGGLVGRVGRVGATD